MKPVTTINAKVTTLHGEAYARRLCRHFAHKIPAAYKGREAAIEFPFGRCTISVSDDSMQFCVELSDPSQVDRAKRVISDHLLRMANKDKPNVVWAV